MVELEIREGLKVQIVPVEVEGDEPEYRETSSADEIFRAKLGPALEIIGGLADSLGDQVVRIGQKVQPDEITLSFTVGFTKTAGVIIASGAASGTIAVSMKWAMAKGAPEQ